MKIYVAHTFGQVGVWHEEDDPEHYGFKAGDPELGDIVLSRHTSLAGAQKRCEDEFAVQSVKDAGSPSWRKDVILWAPPHDEARTGNGHLSLWSLLPAAAPAMNDPNRAHYPQMRTTTFWVEPLEVIEDHLPEPLAPGEKLVLTQSLRGGERKPGDGKAEPG